MTFNDFEMKQLNYKFLQNAFKVIMRQSRDVCQKQTFLIKEEFKIVLNVQVDVGHQLYNHS